MSSPSCFWLMGVMGRSGSENALTQPEFSFCEVKYEFRLPPSPPPCSIYTFHTPAPYTNSIHIYECWLYRVPPPPALLPCALLQRDDFYFGPGVFLCPTLYASSPPPLFIALFLSAFLSQQSNKPVINTWKKR